MDVKTVEKPSRSSKSLVKYLLHAGVLIAAGGLTTVAIGVLPPFAAGGFTTFVVPGDGALLTIGFLVLVLGLVCLEFVDEFAANRPSVYGRSSLAGKVHG